MPIGSRIKSLRLQQGLTQKQLGDLCGMADSAIRRYESDRGNPTDKTLRRIAAALGVSMAYLQGWDDVVADLEAAGMSVKNVADEMNIPVERIMEIVNSQEPSSAEAAEKIIRVASMLTKEATRNAQKDESSHTVPGFTGKTLTFQPPTPEDAQLIELGGLPAVVEFYRLPEEAQSKAREDIRGFVEYTIEKYKKQAAEDKEKTPPQPE